MARREPDPTSDPTGAQTKTTVLAPLPLGDRSEPVSSTSLGVAMHLP
jgi:hypothetical protein